MISKYYAGSTMINWKLSKKLFSYKYNYFILSYNYENANKNYFIISYDYESINKNYFKLSYDYESINKYYFGISYYYESIKKTILDFHTIMKIQKRTIS